MARSVPLFETMLGAENSDTCEFGAHPNVPRPARQKQKSLAIETLKTDALLPGENHLTLNQNITQAHKLVLLCQIAFLKVTDETHGPMQGPKH